MAEERLTLAVLRKILVQQAGVSEEVANTFLTHLFPVIVEGLRKDKKVQINGLGTFRLLANAPRRSVNVTTGETILIPGFNKVSFTPDNELRDKVNAEYAHLESQIIDENGEIVAIPKAEAYDPMERFGEQADEISDILAHLNDPIEAVAEEAVSVTEETVSGIEETVLVEESEPEPIEEPAPAEVPIAEAAPEVVSVPIKQPVHRSPNRPWLVIGISVSVFCLFLVVTYFILQQRITRWADDYIKAAENEEIVLVDTDENCDLTLLVTSIKPGEKRVYTEFITTDTLTEGSRLTWLSRKYYGAPNFWVYIYEANQDVLTDPNSIPVGVQVRIPKLPAHLIDINNEESMQQAQLLHNQILGTK